MPTSAAEPPAERADQLQRRLGAGRALDGAVRERMESGFGRPLANVRLHDDATAADAAAALGARAFALGDHVVFGAGAYRPGTPAGDSLIAHELAHTQQRAADATRFVSRRGDGAEREAGAAAAALRRGQRPSLGAAREAAVHRQPVGGEGAQEEERWVAPELPAPGGETLEFGGLTFSQDAVYARAQLERYYAEHGATATEELVRGARTYARNVAAGVPTAEANEQLRRDLERYGPGDVSGVPLSGEQLAEGQARVAFVNGVADTIESEWRLLRDDLAAFLPTFQRTGEEIVRVLLGESERQINAERARYGITEESRWEETGRERGQVMRRVTTYGMARNAESQGLAAAARDLAARLNRIQERQREQMRFVTLRTRRVGREDYDVEEIITDRQAYDAAGEQVRLAQQEYDEARAAAEAEYPLLASFTERGDRGAIRTIAAGPGGEAARLIAQETGEKLANIATVRENLGERFSIWKQPAIVDMTKTQLRILPGSPRARAVDENIQRIQDEEFWRNLAFAVIGIALALIAAIPTGGASIGVAVAVGTAEVAGLALTIYSLQDSIRRYQLESAAAGTAFQRARAISQEEPSLFWVALEVVGAVLQIRGAARTFRNLAQLHRAAVSAAPAVAGAVDQPLENLLAEARRVSPRLAEQLAEDVAARRAIRGALTDIADEAAEAAAGTGGRAGTGLASALRRFLSDLLEAIRSWARRVFDWLGFTSFQVVVEGEYIAVYGIRSRVLLARIKVGSVQDVLISNNPRLAGLRHSRATQLGRAAATADDALRRLLRGNAVRLSEDIGEVAAAEAVRSRFGLLAASRIFHGHGSGVFDFVYELGGVIYIVEAKGGTGRIGTRVVRAGLSAEQGTVTYIRSICNAMRASEPGLVAKIESALSNNKLRYILTETPIPSGTGRLETTVSEFVVPNR